MNSRRKALGLVMLAATLVLAGCAGHRPRPHTAAPAPPLPKHGASVYRIVKQTSQLRIQAYSTGLLAGLLGHAHLITTSDIHGAVYRQADIGDSGFDLRVPLKSLVVDKASQRRQQGPELQTPLSAQARQGTREHMLGPYELDADRYPIMALRSVKISGSMPHPNISVRVTLHGANHDYTVPTTIVASPHQLVASGRLVVRQSDFGITPYSIFGGGLKVADALAVSFHLVAVPDADSSR